MTFHFWEAADETRSGTFYGHAIGGCFSTLFGTTWLLLMLYRSKYYMSRGQTQSSYCDLYVPERDPTILNRMGWIMVLGNSFGMAVELPNNDGWIPVVFHMTLYFSFFVVGVTALLEARRRVPPDSWRVTYAIGLVLTGHMLWYHGDRYSPVDLQTHLSWSKLTVTPAVIMLYSVMRPQSTFAYVASMGMLVLNGTWMITIGFYTSGVDLSATLVETWVAVQGMVITLAIVAIPALVLDPYPEEDNNNNKLLSSGKTITSAAEYSALKGVAAGDDSNDDV